MHPSRGALRTIRVIVADDHAVFTEGLVKLLQEVEGIEVVGTAKDGEKVVEEAARLLPDIVLMDIAMPALDGVQAARELKRRLPGVKVILLTMHKDAQFIKAALLPEVSAYVLKDDAFADLLAAIEAVASGKTYMSPAIAERMRELKEAGARLGSLLTPREREVLRLIARGLTNKQISKKLHLSLKTVDTHRTNLMQKLDIHTTAELVRFAINSGLTD